jgi:homoserine O-succinyltransferase
VDEARREPLSPVVVHVVEPGRPGGGMYAKSDPDYFVLNTPCGQHSMYPFPELVEDDRLGRGFFEWVSEQGYRWHGHECRVSGPGDGGTAVEPNDFLPRRLMGEYLEWFYRALCEDAPPNVEIVHHRASAVDVEPTASGRERVHLDDGSNIVVDHVILTTGHMKETPRSDAVSMLVTSPYPIEGYLRGRGPSETVGIEGMGLVALDVVTALTIGLGGRYESGEAGTLRYLPSGREPSLYLFSRSGYPYCAKSFGASDPMGDYKPAICTVEAVASLQGRDAGGARRQIDARRELLPLVFAEMELHYYTSAARMVDGPQVERDVRARLVAGWAAGTFSDHRSQLAARYGTFVASEHFFVGQGRHYRDSEDYESAVYATVAADAREALVAGGASPVKTALETLRALRDTLRMAIEFRGLTLSSHLDFVANLQSRFARLVAGPPVFRSQQLLALVDAGILKLPFGPSPEVLPAEGGGVLVRSTVLEHPYEVVVDRLVRAHLDLPSVTGSASPLLTNLVRRGRARPLTFQGTPAGSIDLTEDFHPLDDKGRPETNLWVFGVLSEGVRYFTLYIPSPKSRVRAFLDAQACAAEIVGAKAEPILRGNATRPSQDSQAARAEHAARGPLRVALVNNMSDGAFEETERQFSSLLHEGLEGSALELRRFSLPGVPRGEKVQALIAKGYEDIDQLWRQPLDALVVTGAEPQRAELTEEPYWPALRELLSRGRESAPSMLVSCLSAHGALWSFDQLPRRVLPEKCSGVFPQVVDQGHPLMAGVGELSLPHSRFNEIPTAELLENGYRVLAASEDGGWTVAVGAAGPGQLLLLQGHPEYERQTLLREYRRDVRRYLTGHQGSYPHMPKGYLDIEGVAALEQFQADVTAEVHDPALMDRFPFDFVAAHVDVDWQGVSRLFMKNWVRSVRERSHDLRAGEPALAADGPALERETALQ